MAAVPPPPIYHYEVSQVFHAFSVEIHAASYRSTADFRPNILCTKYGFKVSYDCYSI